MEDVGTRVHQMKANFVWDLPDMHWGDAVAQRVVAAVVNDWQLSGVWTDGSGEHEVGAQLPTGCFQNIWDMAIARNFRLGGGRQIQVRAEMFNAFNTVIYNGVETVLELTSPTNQTVRNPQFLANGQVDPERLLPNDAGFGAVTGAQALRSAQVQVRFSF